MAFGIGGISAGQAFVRILPDMAALQGAQFGTALEKSISRGLTSKLDSIGKSITKKVTLPILGIGAAGVTMAVQVDKSLRSINSLFGLTGQAAERNFGEISKVVRDLSDDVGIAQDAISEGLYQAISAGVPKENAFTFMKVAAKAAVAGVTDINTSVEGISKVINAFGLSFEDAEMVADSMFTTVNKGIVTFEEMSQSMFQVAPAAAAAGLDLKEVNAALTALTLQGIPMAESATRVQAALSAVARNSKELDPLFQKMGISSAEAALKQKGLKFVLDTIHDAAGGSQSALLGYLGRIEAVQAVNVLAGKGADTFTQAIKDQASAAGASGKAFEEIEKSASRKLERAFVQVKNALIDVGVVLIPIVTKIVSFFAKIFKAFASLPAPVKNLIVILLGVAAAIGPLILIGLKLFKMFTMLRVVLFNLRMLLFLNPFIIWIAAIAAIIFVIIKFRKQIVAALKVVWSWIKKLGGVFAGIGRSIGRFFSSLGSTIARFFTQTLPKAFMDGLRAVGDFFKKLPGRILGFINQGLQTLIAGIIVIGAMIVIGLVKGFVAYLKLVIDFWTKLPGRILAAMGAIGRFLFKAGKLLLKGLLNGIVAYAKLLWSFWTKLPGRILGFLRNAGSWLFGVGKKIIRGLLDGIGNLAERIKTFFKSLPGNIVRWIGDLSKLLYNIGKDILKGLLNGAKEALGAVGDFFKGIGKKIVDWKGPLDYDRRLLIPAGRAIMQGLVRGVANEERTLRSKLAAIARMFEQGLQGGRINANLEPMRLQRAAVVRPHLPDAHRRRRDFSPPPAPAVRHGDTYNITENYPRPEKASVTLPKTLRKHQWLKGRR